MIDRRLLPVLLLSLLTSTSQAQLTHDVVVYGGTSAGITAAIQATRMGHSAIIIEPSQHLGGLTSGGLGWTDSGRKDAIGGLSREFYQRVKKYYDAPAAWHLEDRAGYDRYRPNDDAMWTFEPRVAEAIYEEMLLEAGVSIVKGRRLDREDGVILDKGRIREIHDNSGSVYRGRMFVDATYEGDLMAAADVSYAVGREANSDFGETLNGVQKRLNTHNHRFVVDVSPYVEPGNPDSGLVPGVHGNPPGKDGTGDDRIQAYCFRMCMSNIAKNRVPFPKPADYDETQFELLFRNFEAGDLRLPFKPDMMPNGKTDTNNNCAFSTDNIGANYDYPEGSYEQREAIIRQHETYQKGLMWTLSNHPRVPKTIRDQMSVWGLAKDEFVDNGNWPHQLYIREARRLMSDYVMTEDDCRRVRKCPDSVGLGSYNMDSHNCQRYITEDGLVQNEGDVQESPGGPYMISYRSIVPKKGEAENLLVPVCVSSTHIAFGSIRMEPVFMILGQSAATAASIAMEQQISVQEVDYADLRERLLQDGQVLDLPPGIKPRITLQASSFDGIVIDDADAKVTGPWSGSSSVPGHIGRSYLHDGDDAKGRMSITYTTTLQPGRYHVKLSFPPSSNRATNVPVTIRAGENSKTVLVNQRKMRPADQVFVTVSEQDLSGEVQVTISNARTDGHVIADAVQFLPVKK
ncbi:MAG: FAD-dependent oxidoreductase [Fuerstiella sp.]